VNLEQLIAAAQEGLDEKEREQVSPRFVRFLIGNGLIAGARGIRSKPEYGDDHVEGIRSYLAMRRIGLPVAAIRAMLHDETDVVTVELARGVVLTVDRRAVGDPAAAEEAVRSAVSKLPDLISAIRPTRKE
jgi:hypothetical protein